VKVRKLWSSISRVIYVVATRSQRQLSTRLPGKAFENVSFNVRRENKFIKSEKSSFTSSECLDNVALDISLVGRDSWGNFAVSFAKSTLRCVWKVLYAERFRIVRSSCCRRLLKNSVQENCRIRFASFLRLVKCILHCIVVEIVFAVEVDRHQNISVFLTVNPEYSISPAISPARKVASWVSSQRPGKPIRCPCGDCDEYDSSQKPVTYYHPILTPEPVTLNTTGREIPYFLLTSGLEHGPWRHAAANKWH